MNGPKPHFLLFCDGNVSANDKLAGSQRGRWRFVLEDLVSGEKIEATDHETACAPDRTALVAVLRGLEALEQPSRVTLVTTSRYVSRGLQYGLTEWRDNDYSWERFGAVQPIRNADIWKRIDRALAFHQVQCRWMAQEDGAETTEETTSPAETASPSTARPAEPRIESLAVTSVAAPASQIITSREHRPSPSKRTLVSTTNYQRVYVDTPHRNPDDLINLPSTTQTQSATRTGLPIASCPNRSHKRRSYSIRSWLSPRWFTSRLLWPVRIVRRGQLWLCGHVWELILTFDEWLESLLRCLLLLDPKKNHSRH